jgi:tetratricopeptide (TPR) repeat protein
LKALGHDDNADVANLIGYSYHKLGDYKISQIWYERALKTDPEPRADLAVLRPVAARTGQPRSGRIPSD